MTNDLLFTLDLIDAVPSLKLAADLSHYIVGREFEPPISEHDNRLILQILHRSRAFHGRVASSEQVQIQTSFKHHQPWVDVFANWWREGFRYFQEMVGVDEILTFKVELGPPWYAATGPEGKELSDRWAEALQMADLARDLWASASRGDATASTPDSQTS